MRYGTKLCPAPIRALSETKVRADSGRLGNRIVEWVGSEEPLNRRKFKESS